MSLIHILWLLEFYFSKSSNYIKFVKYNMKYDWRSYMQNTKEYFNIKRQCGGGGVMVSMMSMPNDLLSFKVITGNINSEGYIKHLAQYVVPII